MYFFEDVGFEVDDDVLVELGDVVGDVEEFVFGCMVY